jgi:lysophospholipase L1-like esterase
MAQFPLKTMLAAITCAAILLGVRYGVGYGVNGGKGFDLASAKPIGAFRFDRASLIPVVPVPLPPVPPEQAIPDPLAHGREGMSSAATANSEVQTEFLFDEDGGLDHFYAALRALKDGAGERTVRIVHYGDSPTTADLITGDARELLQERFGNAGAGFVLIAKPWAWYGHRGVEVSGTGWTIATAVGMMHEGIYGLGGAMFTGQAGATSTIKLSAGAASTSVEVEYLETPGGGDVDVFADGMSAGTVKTAGEAKKNGATVVDLPSGTKVVELKVSGGPVQLFGVALGRGTRGITYDSIGLNGASTTVMSRGFNEANWTGALQHRSPDLVVINYGTNESSYPSYVEKQYEPELLRAIGRVRTALPEVSILVMSPMDRGERSGDSITTMRAIPEIVEIQKRVAKQMGCGFFNTYEAMGGDGTMSRWYDGHPRMVAADLIHPSPQGARIVAESLTGQLLIGYERYRKNHPVQKTAETQAVDPPKRMAVLPGRADLADRPEGVQ